MGTDFLIGLILFAIGTLITLLFSSDAEEKYGIILFGELISIIVGVIGVMIIRSYGSSLLIGVEVLACFIILSILVAVSLEDRKSARGALLGILVLGVVFSAIIWGVSTWMVSTTKTDSITFVGKVVNPSTGKWNNNRLVIIYKNDKEIGRAISAQGEFKANNEGVIDGLFVLEIPNEYRLTAKDLKNFKIGQVSGSFWKSNLTIYSWFPDVPEGKVLSTHINSKNIDYIIEVLDGDISTLPPEIVNGTTELRGGQIVVAAPTSVESTNGQSNNDILVQDIQYATNTEIANVNTVLPINVLNNCDGTSDVSQKYTQTQTFIHQYSGEIGASIGVEIPLGVWGKLLPSLQAKYGFENGQVDTISIEYNTAAAPGSSVAYVVTLKEVWESGIANVTEGNISKQIPFRVKTNLIYEITSQPRTCP